jgi:magnesium-transporting ATPase (P-type)
MFVVGTIFPPLLPSVFVVSVAISVKRLQQKRICCMHAERILVAGKVRYTLEETTGTSIRILNIFESG